jgi:membrane-bound lytic murein transglycosylase D
MSHAAIVVATAPETYGVDVEPEPLLEADSVRVTDAVDLRGVAECAGSSLDRVRLLNPALRRLATPAHRSFDVRVPKGTAAETDACLRAIPADRRVAFRAHTVSRGQTLAAIARRYGTRTADIAQANGLSTRAKLAKGQELIIPVSPRSTAPETRVAEAKPRPPEPPAVVIAEAAAAPAEDAGKVRISYKVKSGDTLSAIARTFKTTIGALQSWNGLSGSRIAAGNTLTIYTVR